MEELISELEKCRIRLLSGKTLRESVQDLKQPKNVPSHLIQEWTTLFERITQGQISAVDGVESWIQRLRSEHKTLAILKKSTMQPKLQMYGGMAVLALYAVAVSFIAPPSMQPSLLHCTIAASLFGIAWMWCRLLLKRFQRSLWFLDWLRWMEQIEMQLRWGATFQQCFYDQAVHLEKLPKGLRTIIQKEFDERNIEDSFANTPRVSVAEDWTVALDLWRSMLKASQEGSSITALLGACLKELRGSHLEKMEERGQKLALWMLVPLMLSGVPALGVMIVGPVMQSLSVL